MKLPHTPGPWKMYLTEDEAGDLIYNIGTVAKGDFIADTGYLGSAAKRKANARLIAAAPELLAMLEEFVSDIRVAYLGLSDACDIHETALADEWPDLAMSYLRAVTIIKKAKGVK